MDERRYLRIYLAERLILAHGARRLASRVADTPDGALGAQVTTVLDADVQTLTSLLRQLGARPPRVRMGAVALAERLGRLKLNGRIRDRSPLTDLQELDGLTIGLGALAQAWAALDAAGVIAQEVVGGRATRLRRLADHLDARRPEIARRALATS